MMTKTNVPKLGTRAQMVTLPFFPSPYPNELFYSVLARYKVRCGYISDRHLLHEVFNRYTTLASPEMPNCISLAVDNIRPTIASTAKEIIRDHTLYPLYTSFSPSNIKQKVEAEMLGHNSNTYMVTLGIARCFLPQNTWFRYCPLCVEEQLVKYGEPYWDRRWFNLFTQYCPIHGVAFVPTPRATHNSSRHELRPLLEDLVNKSKIQTALVQATWQDNLVSKVAKHLLSHQNTFSYSQLTNFYRSRAAYADFSRGQKIKQEEVAYYVKSFWSWHWLTKQGFTDDYFNNMICTLFRKHRKQHQYIMHAIAGLPFFNGDIQKWWSTLVKTPSPSHQSNQKHHSTDTRKTSTSLETSKQAWLKLVKPLGPKEARYATKSGRKLYIKIYRADKKWLLDVNKQYRVKRATPKNRVSWRKRDFETVKAMFHHLYQSHDMTTPRRSKRWFLSQLHNSATIENNLYRLPKTTAFLTRYTESYQDYQSRRLVITAIEFAKIKKRAKKWQLYRNARINTQRSISSQVRRTCDWCVDWLEQNIK